MLVEAHGFYTDPPEPHTAPPNACRQAIGYGYEAVRGADVGSMWAAVVL